MNGDPQTPRTKETSPGMKAISLWQPWASLVAARVKQIETRHWYTAHRGQIAIHAAKKLVSECGEELDEICLDEFGCEWRRTLPRGAVVATAQLVACERMIHPVYPTPQGYPSRTEYACGNWQPGRFGWLLDDIKEIERPIPYRGMQGLFTIPAEVLL